MNIYTSADQLVGRTPLLELTHLEKAEGLKAIVLAKLESFNPSGQRQGPDRQGHDRGGGAQRQAEARLCHHRAHQRQYRYWAWPPSPLPRDTGPSW